ncbi:hypothetical protein OG250_15850 [Streptomyces sp. NBC_00487]|uniref:hypothetical protein n=1 Tax=unclassified Streptomyces TaxID=2593676 RepID=UPI002E172490|nr:MULTISPECIES: hypothetical protein [unclassified Streptomyces]
MNKKTRRFIVTALDDAETTVGHAVGGAGNVAAPADVVSSPSAHPPPPPPSPPPP